MKSYSVDAAYLKTLAKLNVSSMESTLYIEGDTLLKIFKDDSPWYLTRKERKVELLAQGRPLFNTPRPIEKIVDDGYFIGYRIKYMKNYTPLFDFDFDRYGDPSFFKLVSNISRDVKKIHRDPRKIIISDLHFDNILFYEKTHCFCDEDSWRIGNLPAETIPIHLQQILSHKRQRLEENTNTDRICLLTSMIISLFEDSPLHISAYDYDSYAEIIPTLKEVRNIVLSLKDPTKPIPYVPYLHEIISKKDLPTLIKRKK